MPSSAFDRRAIPHGARVSRWIGPEGWDFRRIDWPSDGAARGAVLFQTGRGDFFEKYLEAFAHWQNAGWAVSAFDWRGQGGSGRLLADPHIGHIEDFATHVADLRAFWLAWASEAPGPRVVMGHSMGGHIVLRALVEQAIAPDAAVLIAPMLGLRSPLGPVYGERLARLMARAVGGTRAAWKENERPATRTTRQALLTHDRNRYDDELWWRAKQPALALGPPSWRWLVEAFASTRTQRADPRLATIDVPLLMLIAEADKLVDPGAAHGVASRLPACRIDAFGTESAHEILREADPVRMRALAAIDSFLADRG